MCRKLQAKSLVSSFICLCTIFYGNVQYMNLNLIYMIFWKWYIWQGPTYIYCEINFVIISKSWTRVRLYSDSVKKRQKIFWNFPFFFLVYEEIQRGKIQHKILIFLKFSCFVFCWISSFATLDKKTVLKISSVLYSLPYFYR